MIAMCVGFMGEEGKGPTGRLSYSYGLVRDMVIRVIDVSNEVC